MERMSNSGSPEMVYCRDCGTEIRARAEICPECGIRQQQPDYGSEESDKDPGLAAVGSFIIPGVGQVYNGEIAKGIIGGVVFFAFALTGVGLIVAIPLWIWLIYDAYKTADTAGGSPADQSSDASNVQTGDVDQVDESVLEALEWYKSQTTGAGLVGETKRSVETQRRWMSSPTAISTGSRRHSSSTKPSTARQRSFSASSGSSRTSRKRRATKRRRHSLQA